MSLIAEKTMELCQTIAADSQFVKFQQIVDAFIKNEDGHREYQDLLELQRTLHGKKMEGTLTQDEINAFDEKCNVVFAQPVVAEFLEAQDALDQLNDMISRHVELTFEFGRVPTKTELEEELEAESELNDHHHACDNEDCGCGDDCGCDDDCGDDCSCS